MGSSFFKKFTLNELDKGTSQEKILKILKEDLLSLHKFEANLWELLLKNNKVGIRTNLAEMHSLILGIVYNFNAFEKDTHAFYDQFKQIKIEIKDGVDNLDKLLIIQIGQLNNIQSMSDEQIRAILDQDKSANNSLSQTSHNILVLIETINKELEDISNTEVKKSQEVSNQTDNRSEEIDNRPEEIKKRFILSKNGKTIYDNKTKLTWERDWAKRGKMNWDNAMRIWGEGLTLPSLKSFHDLSLNNNYPQRDYLKQIGFVVSEDKNHGYWTNEEDSMEFARVFGLVEGHGDKAISLKPHPINYVVGVR